MMRYLMVFLVVLVIWLGGITGCAGLGNNQLTVEEQIQLTEFWLGEARNLYGMWMEEVERREVRDEAREARERAEFEARIAALVSILDRLSGEGS